MVQFNTCFKINSVRKKSLREIPFVIIRVNFFIITDIFVGKYLRNLRRYRHQFQAIRHHADLGMHKPIGTFVCLYCYKAA